MIIRVFVVNFPPSSSPQVFFVCLFRSKGIFGGNDDRNGYLFISYEGIVRRRHFVCLSFLRSTLAKKCAFVSSEMAQFVLKIAHLAISMEPTPLLEKVSSYGLLPRLWLLEIYIVLLKLR